MLNSTSPSKLRRVAFMALIGALFCATPVAALPANPTLRTGHGSTVEAPAQWRSASTPTLLRLDPPEGDLRVVLVEVGPAADAAAAIAAAWSAYRPDTHRLPKFIAKRPARDGWDESDLATYDVAPAAHLEVRATAFRLGRAWTVTIVDGAQGTADKRSAELALIADSLRPAGFVRENFASRVARPLDPARVAAIEAFLRDGMAQLGLPGVGLALIDHGRVVFEGGLGVRELGRPEPVDAHTRFMIASNTKGMTTLLLAELVDEGRIGWDEPVVRLYPGFRLGDDATTRSVLVRHLVCACTGLPRKDLDWILDTPPGTLASTTFAQLAATTPTSRFGEVYQYNNLMASAAGYVAAHVVYPEREVGAGYDALMRRRVFDPLGMGETTFSMAQALRGDHASPHAEDVDGVTRVADIGFDAVMHPYRPAGGAWSSAHDLIRYVGLELSGGLLPNGDRLVSTSNLEKRRAPGVPTGERSWYGMGLEVDETWGVPVIHHGGSLLGYKSDLFIVPGAQVGAVVLTNADNGYMLMRPFMRRLLELLYDGRPEAAADLAAVAAGHRGQVVADGARLTVPADRSTAASLASVYASPELGRLRVERSGGRTRFAFAGWSSEVASRRDDDGGRTLHTIDPGEDGYDFVVGRRAGRRTLTIRDGQHVYLFTEAAR